MIHSEQIIDLSGKMREEFKFFNALTHNECAAFLGYCENRQVDAGGTLWTEGDIDNYAAFIVSGKLGIKKKTEFEGKHMIVGTFDRGTVVGELCLLTDKTRSVTAVVLENVDVVALSSRDFERMITEHPMLGLKLLKHIFIVTSKRLSGSYERIASIF
jgi:CRP/FNR family cyclic AMP-dependent transcriptional regulator